MDKRGAIWSILKVIISLVLGGTGLWLVTRGIAAADVLQGALQANWLWITAGLAVIVVTILAKSYRWFLLFFPRAEAPQLPVLVRGIIMGQFFNLLLPVARLGDIVRLLSLPPQYKKGRILGTLVLEKTLDSVMMVITFFVLLPFVIIPDVINNPTVLGAVAFITLLALYLLAFEAAWIVRMTRLIAGYLPEKIGGWLVKLVAAGLEGLAALRNSRAAAEIVLLSAGIAFLSALTPFVLFLAFGFDLNFAAAAALNLAVMIGSLPSSAPANLGVFEFITIVTLQQLGLSSESSLVSFAFVYHLVVIAPVLLMGSYILARQEWPLHFIQRRLAHALGRQSS